MRPCWGFGTAVALREACCTQDVWLCQLLGLGGVAKTGLLKAKQSPAEGSVGSMPLRCSA